MAQRIEHEDAENIVGAGAATLATNIRFLIEKRGWSQRQAASAVSLQHDLGTRTVDYMLAGDANPTLQTLEKVADVLGVPVYLLLADPADLEAYVEAEGLPPFELRRRGITRLRSSSPSAAADDTDSGTMGATRT